MLEYDDSSVGVVSYWNMMTVVWGLCHAGI